jgi:RecB family exonuclease
MTAVQGELAVSVPPRLFGASPSKLDCWLDCPRRYRFGYVDRPRPAKGAPWAHNSLGAAIHSALAQWWHLDPGGRTPAAARRLLDASWDASGFRDGEQADMWRQRAGDMVERYVETLDPHDEPIGVERTVSMRTPRLALEGRIDRLDRRGDELVVVDYKTGRHVLSTDDARGSIALAIYAAAAESTLRMRCRRVELHHLPTGEVVVWEHTDESLARQLGRIEDVGVEAATAHERLGDAAGDPAAMNEIFPPRTGPHCGWCDFLDHCAEGKQATPHRKQPWAGLALDITSTVDDVVS